MDALVLTENITLFGIITASLFGSGHCAAMCGGFVGLYTASIPGAFAHLGYHSGRLITYLLLGALAGAVGSELQGVAPFTGVAQPMAIAASVLLIVWGIGILAPQVTRRIMGVFSRKLLPPHLLALPLKTLIRQGRGRVGRAFPLLLGITSTLLPCGWLYLFVALASGRESVAGGMAVMGAFWLGTVPMLLTIGTSIERLYPTIRRYAPVIAAWVMICGGVTSLWFHAHRVVQVSDSSTSKSSSGIQTLEPCH